MKHLCFFILIALFIQPAMAKKKEQAQWITATTDKLNAEQPQYFYYRKTFKVKKPPLQLMLKVLSLNTYETWINGVPVIFDGKSRNADGELISDTLWLKNYVIKGENCIAIKTKCLPDDKPSLLEGIYLELVSKDSLHIISDESWISGKNEALKIQSGQEFKINYNASNDVFSGFNEYRYSAQVRGKDHWLPVNVLAEAPVVPDECKPAKLVKSERTHRYTGIELPKFLKEAEVIQWKIDFQKPVYFGFKVESIGSKKVTVLLNTVEKGLIELTYLTKEGVQEFVIDMPLTISDASIQLPVYMKVNSIFFKELQN